MNQKEQVETFVAAIITNARTIEGWNIPDLEDGKCFAETVVDIETKPNGDMIICDSYEKFSDIIYTVTPECVWTIRHMYSDEPAEPYSYEKCMADAAIMFTG